MWSDKIFENYLSDTREYIELEKDFICFFQNELSGANIDNAKIVCPLYETSYSNGQPFLDGNPIFSAKDQLSGRSIKVILDEDINELTFFRDKDRGAELVIVGNIHCLDNTKKKMTEWVSTILRGR